MWIIIPNHSRDLIGFGACGLEQLHRPLNPRSNQVVDKSLTDSIREYAAEVIWTYVNISGDGLK
ncbi:hypothetical protein D3C85_1615640 [compost metagenome]